MRDRKEYMRKWRKDHKEHLKELHKTWYEKNRETQKKTSKEYYYEHREEKIIYSRNHKWIPKDRTKVNERARNRCRKLRKEVIAHYGNKCACCGETINEFLCIDHINGGGNRHKQSLNLRNLFAWLKKNNYPDGYQILCYNCNNAKSHYGVCPHQKLKEISGE